MRGETCHKYMLLTQNTREKYVCHVFLNDIAIN